MTTSCVVITGAAGALGSAVARRLVADGYRAALLDVPQAAARLTEVASGLGDVARAYPFDITDAHAWSAHLPRIESELAPVSHAVLVAGTWRGGAPLHAAADDAEWDAMIHTNLDTAHRSLRALLPGMVSRKHGSIVAIGSRAAERPWTSTNAAAYGASKAAVVALVQAVAAELVDAGVRVNAVLPSTLDTPANRRAMPDADASRWVTLESAAGVIAFLLSDAARDLSGVALPLYGRG
jgi:NAD(P)-dependent dehydrogenase (short-subunit alcohol dehydrogenase family)